MPDVEPSLQKSPIFRVRGQTNMLYPNVDLNPENTETLSNINLTERGTAKVRDGYAKYNTTQITESSVAKDVTGIAQLPFKAGTELVLFAGTVFNEETGGTRTARTGSLSLTDNAELRWRIVFFQDSMIATNGTDETVRWTGSGNATDLTSSANIPFTVVKDIVPHRNLLVFLRPTVSGTDHTTRVMWCDLNLRQYTADITNVPTDSFAEVYDQGAPIVGGVDFNDTLYIFKEDGFYPCRISYDTGFFELDILGAIRGFEPIAVNSLVTRVGSPSFLWVVARDGAYVVNPADNSFTLITRELQNDWLNLAQDRLQYAVSWIRQKDHQVRTLLSSAPNSTGHDRVLVWDWETGDAWFDTPKDQINYAASAIISNKEYDFLGSSDGFIHQGNDEDQAQDNDVSFDWDIQHVPTDLGFPGIEKNIINAVTYYRAQTGQQTIQFAVNRDQGRSTKVSTNLTLGTSQKWDTGLKWDSGLTWPGGTNAKQSVFVNRMAETVAAQWSGDQGAEIQAVQYEFVVAE